MKAHEGCMCGPVGVRSDLKVHSFKQAVAVKEGSHPISAFKGITVEAMQSFWHGLYIFISVVLKNES